MTASKDQNTGSIYIRSIALQILNLENANIYKKSDHPQNFLYLIIDPYQRYVHLWYHKWVSFW